MENILESLVSEQRVFKKNLYIFFKRTIYYLETINIYKLKLNHFL